MPKTALYWVRRDLRLTDNPALAAAMASGLAVVPVFILDETVETLGAAAKWRLGLGVAAFATALEQAGSRLILRRGPALMVLRQLISETGATEVHWGRQYDPAARIRMVVLESGSVVRISRSTLTDTPDATPMGSGAVPNPFHGQTRIAWPAAGLQRNLAVYSVAGRFVIWIGLMK